MRRIFAGVASLALAASFLGVPVVAAVAIPATPTNTTAVAISTSQITFSWVENSNQTSFYVTDGTSGIELGATTRSYTWGGLAPNTSKCFWVTAKNSAGQSPWSNSACAATQGSVPATPTNTTAVAISASQITFSWVENSNQTSFYVTDGTTGVSVSATTRSYTWGGLAAGTSKCFWVTAKNASGQSPWSSSACATTLGSIPATPTNTTAVAISTSQITFSWVENSNQTSFYVTDGTSGIELSGTTRSYTWGGIAPNTNKCFWVTAKNASGQSPWSNSACATTLGGIPATPTNTTAVAISASQITFSWVENSNQTSFYVTDGTSGIELSATTRSYTWGGLAPGTNKCFYVTAKNASGQSPWSNAACATTPGAGPMPIRYYDQYQGQTTEDVDCGPAAVAMVLEYRGLRPAGLSDMQWVSAVRTQTGASDTACDGPCGTLFPQLEAALTHYNATWSEVAPTLSPAPSAQVEAIKTAVASGKPVIALVHGADLGRGEIYGDHWIIITGFSADGNTVYVNDPDDQPALDRTGWIVGGVITLPTSILSTAFTHAAYGPYAIIVN